MIPNALTIAGSDSSGGAGIQADLKTFSALGVYGASVITALTAQNTKGVHAIHGPPVSFIEAQIDAVLGDLRINAIKIGMVGNAEAIAAIASKLSTLETGPIVLDPVMVAQSGDRLVQDDTVEAIKKLLMPVADVVTPNLPEAEILLGRRIESPDEIKRAAMELSGFGSRSILIKGGHGAGKESADLFYIAKEERFIELFGKRIETKNNHGTGCTLSSAIAAYLAKGCGIEEAARKAKTYIKGAIKAGANYTIGKGCGPVHHFFQFRD
jgi:hydroxymethylpyrimidine/phosphomethylpyrimidine kinase